MTTMASRKMHEGEIGTDADLVRRLLAGQFPFWADLIDAERILLEFQLSNERALADHARGLARLEMLVGRELPAVGDEAAEEEQEETGRAGGDRGGEAAAPSPDEEPNVSQRAEEAGND